MRRRPAWVKAWAVTALLCVLMGFAMALTPDRCNLLSNCPWTSAFGIFVLGAPVIALLVIVALGMSVVPWWRRR